MSEREFDQQAQALADTAGSATVAARNYLLTAAELGSETQQALRRCEDDVVALRQQERGVTTGDHPRPYLRNAIDLADMTDRTLRATEARIDEMGQYLTGAGHALTAAHDALLGLEDRDPPVG